MRKAESKSRPSEKGGDVGGHIVLGCSEIHGKSSAAEKPSGQETTKKSSSKWRTCKIQSTDDKHIMDKFESSLKKRLLSSASFTNQVPIFNGNPMEERHRMKINRRLDDELNKNESVFNAVFPARKESGKNFNCSIDEELLTKRNKESHDWLKQIKSDTELSSRNEFTRNESKTTVDPSPRSVKGIPSENKRTDDDSDITAHREFNDGPLEQLSHRLSPPNLSVSKGKRGKSTSGVSGEIRHLQPESAERSRKSTSGKLKSVEELEPFKTEAAEKTETILPIKDSKDKIRTKRKQKPVPLSSGRKSVSSKKTHNEKNDVETSFRVIKSAGELLKYPAESKKDILKRKTLRSDYIDISGERKSDKEAVTDAVHRHHPLDPSLAGEIKSTSADPSRSSAPQESWNNFKEYKVMYFQTERDAAQEFGDESQQISTDISAVSVDEQNPAVQTEAETAPERETSVQEEDCTAEPCNEPVWFEEYGIDKKSRKGKEDEFKSDESDSKSYFASSCTF